MNNIGDSDDFDEFLEGFDDPSEDNTSYNFRELMDALEIEGELIVTIPEDQVQTLKNGLIMRKSKDNRKLKRSGMLPNDKSLFFTDYPAKDKEGNSMPGISNVHIRFKEKKSVTILGITVPDKTL